MGSTRCSWLLVATLAGLGTMNCGGSSRPPTSPTPTPNPTPTPTTWSMSGELVDTAGRQPLGNTQIEPTWGPGAITTSADGSYALTSASAPPNPFRLVISGPNLVRRELWFNSQSGARSGVTIDAIREAAPFSMEFYRNFVRGTFDAQNAPFAVLRWMDSPRFYIKTVDQNGRAVEAEVLQVVRDAIPRAVTAYSAGRLSVAALETGSETRAEAPGWILVNIRRDPNERQTCGTARIGANPGLITLNNDVCSCGSNKIPGTLVMHEVGHALGFFHVPDRNSVMFPFIPGNCPAGQLSAAEQYHAAIAYSRPRGNTEPDSDPSSSRNVIAPILTTDR